MNAPALLCKKTPNGVFTTEARARVLLDLLEEENRLMAARVNSRIDGKEDVKKSDLTVRETAKESICKHYEIDVRTLHRWCKLNKDGQSLEPKPRSGRPKVVTSPVKKRICEAFNDGNGTSIRGTTSALKKRRLAMPDGTPYRTTYRTKRDGVDEGSLQPESKRVRLSPSVATVARVIAEGKTMGVKKRPALTAENKLTRYKFAVAELAKTDEDRNDNTVVIDEAWITLEHRGTGRIVEHPKGPKLKASQKIRQVKSKRHPAKVMVIAVLARPKILNKETAGKNEPARFDAEQNGKVAIMRVVEERALKRNVFKVVNGVKTLVKDKTRDTKVVSVTIDGARYKDFLTRPGGVFDKIREYFGENVTVRFQEDGAPGHGYNNRNKRKPTQVHEEMTAIADQRNIDVYKQPHNSPETNPLDLGIWFSIQAAVKHMDIDEDADRNDDGYLESLIWKATKKAWEELESRTIWNCWMVKDEILKEIRRSRGEPIISEPHSGIRERWGTHKLNE